VPGKSLQKVKRILTWTRAWKEECKKKKEKVNEEQLVNVHLITGRKPKP
jgi:hypothetical protein